VARLRIPLLCAVLLGAPRLLVGCGADVAQPEPGDVHGTPLRRNPSAASDALAVGDTSAAPTPAAPPPATEPAASAGATSSEEPVTVGFEELSGFDYATYAAESTARHEIPEKVRALSGRNVAVDGYMMPLVYAPRGTTKFLLMRNQYGCCYATSPKLNEWIEVTMEGDAVAEYVPHVLVTVWGKLEVKEELREGAPVGLYKLRATRTEFTEAK
jgi:hypothetical protein